MDNNINNNGNHGEDQKKQNWRGIIVCLAVAIGVFFIFSLMILSVSAFFAAITIPPVLRSIRLQRAGTKEFSAAGSYSCFL